MPLAWTIEEACVEACAGRSTIYDAIKNRELRAVKRGRRTLILDEDLRPWVKNLPPLEPGKPNQDERSAA